MSDPSENETRPTGISHSTGTWDIPPPTPQSVGPVEQYRQNLITRSTARDLAGVNDEPFSESPALDDDVTEFIRDMASPTDGPDLNDEELAVHLALLADRKDGAPFDFGTIRAYIEAGEKLSAATPGADFKGSALRALDSLVERLKRAEEERDGWREGSFVALHRIESLETALQLAQGALRETRAFLDRHWGSFPVGWGSEVSDLDDLTRNALPPTSPTGEEGS